MKKLLFLVLAFPVFAWAQSDSLQPIRRDALKPIENELLPAYHSRYGTTVRSQYIYDGLDIKAKALAPYIIASGDLTAIHEFSAYMNSRHAGGWLIAGGITSALIGAIIMGSNSPGSDGKFMMQQAYVCPTGYACGGTGTNGKLVYGGQTAGYQTVTDTQRRNTYSIGGLMLLSGAILAGIGWGMQMPGQHVRRAVQYYNRALKQPLPGVSWKFQPYSTLTNAGVGLVGQF